MRKPGFTEKQIVEILQERDRGGNAAELRGRRGISSTTLCKWKSRYGGMDASKLRHLRDVEEENAKLKRLLADAMLDNAGLKEVLKKNF